jgi:hypothetical protein
MPEFQCRDVIWTARDSVLTEVERLERALSGP